MNKQDILSESKVRYIFSTALDKKMCVLAFDSLSTVTRLSISARSILSWLYYNADLDYPVSGYFVYNSSIFAASFTTMI